MSFTGLRDEVIGWLLSQPTDARYECKLKRRRRTLTQNAYYWVLVNELARAVGLSDSEVHEKMLREYGVCEPMLLRIEIDPADYFEHWDADYRTVAMEEGVYRQVMAYKGSSKMDTGEFTKLIDGIRWECEQLGIDVMTPEEIARLRFVGPGGE